MDHDASGKDRERQDNDGNSEGMAQPVDRMLMAACVLSDPLFVGASAKHGRIIPLEFGMTSQNSEVVRPHATGVVGWRKSSFET